MNRKQLILNCAIAVFAFSSTLTSGGGLSPIPVNEIIKRLVGEGFLNLFPSL